jgi:hypothetical protein
VKKKFKGEEHLEHLYRDRALEDINQNSLFKHHDSIQTLMAPMYDPVREDIENP